jgi:predicted CoA-binding protein
MEDKKTVVLGATTNQGRYAFLAANLLREYNHSIVPVGIKKGNVAGEEILDLKEKPEIKDVDTVTLYVGRRNLPEWHEYILGLKPKRIVFNPGTEDDELKEKARNSGIETVYGCTLVMLRSNTY